MKLIFASANDHKVEEINETLRGVKNLEVVSMKDIGCLDDIPETSGTIQGNSLQKAQYLFEKYHVDCFSDDSGLEIDDLNGEPGVDTAHYSGSRDADKNIAFVLEKMGKTERRTARFRTIITLILRGQIHVFAGVCEGTIRLEKSLGNQGFGYDPIFQPEGYNLTFAELLPEVKSQISHRGRAMKLLLDFLKTVSNDLGELRNAEFIPQEKRKVL